MNLLQVDEEQNLSLPEEWQWVRLGDLTNTTSGTTPSRNRNDYYRGNIPWIKTGELRDSTIETAEEYITEVALKETSLKLLPAGTLLVAMYGQGQTRGRTGILAIPATINQACFAILPNPERFAPRFLQFWFRYNYVNLRQETEKRGGNQPNLNGKILSDLPIPLPPLAEQKRIVAILDEKLAAVERAQAAAQAQLQAAQALPAAYLRTVFENEEAQEWPRYALGEVSSIVAKQVDPTIPAYSALPHVNGENIESGTLRLKNIKTAAEDGMTSGKYMFEAGDVLYSKLRPYLRKVALVNFDGLCSADMYPLKADPQMLNAQFLAWLLLSEEFTAYTIDESERSRMPKLNRQQLFSWAAPIPPLARQYEITQMLQEKMVGVEQLVKSLQAQLETINHFPSALLNQAFTGDL